MNGNFL